MFLLTAPVPRGPLLRRCIITVIIAPTAPCASLMPTRELPVYGYIAGLTDMRPSLLCISGLATVPPPLRRRAPWRHSPDPSHPRDAAFAVLQSARRSHSPQLPSRGVRVTTLQRFRYVAARLLARPPGQSRLATARTLSSELSPRWSPNPDVRFATWLPGCCHGRFFPGWSETFAGCTVNRRTLKQDQPRKWVIRHLCTVS